MPVCWLCVSLLKNPQLKVVPVCMLDDDPSKQGQQIYGVPVVGKLTILARTVGQAAY